MKLFEERLLRKSSKAAGYKSIAKHTAIPRGITLRSRKINYTEESPYE